MWRLSPRGLAALEKRWVERERRENWRFAVLYAVIANALGGGGVKPEDFMPESDKHEQTPEEQLQVVAAAFGMPDSGVK